MIDLSTVGFDEMKSFLSKFIPVQEIYLQPDVQMSIRSIGKGGMNFFYELIRHSQVPITLPAGNSDISFCSYYLVLTFFDSDAEKHRYMKIKQLKPADFSAEHRAYASHVFELNVDEVHEAIVNLTKYTHLSAAQEILDIMHREIIFSPREHEGYDAEHYLTYAVDSSIVYETLIGLTSLGAIQEIGVYPPPDAADDPRINDPFCPFYMSYCYALVQH